MRDLGYFAAERTRRGIFLAAEHLKAISDRLGAGGLDFLVFGVGNDSALWLEINRGGRTVFIEDNAEWARSIEAQCPGIRIIQVEYQTQRRDWRRLLLDRSKLELSLPPEVRDRKWDVILVDGPYSHLWEAPGRMKSIFAASRLIKEGGTVFVDDCHRWIEWVYTWVFLSPRSRFRRYDSLFSFDIQPGPPSFARTLRHWGRFPPLSPRAWPVLAKRGLEIIRSLPARVWRRI